MTDLALLRVTQVRIYPIDALPLPGLLLADNLARLQGLGSFQAVGPAASESGVGALVLTLGEARVGDDQFLIEQLAIERRRIILNAQASSANCDSFMERVHELLAEVRGDRAVPETGPLLQSDETETACILAVGFDRLVADPLASFLQRARSAFDHPAALASVVPARVAARVSYAAIPEPLRALNLSLAEKLFILERRAGTPDSENRVYAKSPTRSEIHIRLLEDLERAFTA